jgi:hypothetical protein
MGLDGSAWVMEPVLLLDTLFLKGISARLNSAKFGYSRNDGAVSSQKRAALAQQNGF